MGLRALLERSQEEFEKAEEERVEAEQNRARVQARAKSSKERMGRQLDAAVTVGVSGATAVGAREVRKRVNLTPAGVDLGGVAAVVAFMGAVVQGGKKYGAAVAGVAAGLACEYALHKMDPATPTTKDKPTTTSGLEHEETGYAGDLEGRRRMSLRERLNRSRGYGARIDARDVIDMPQG